MLDPAAYSSYVFGHGSVQILIHVLLYVSVMVVGSIVFAKFWIMTTNMGPEAVAKQIENSGLQIPGFRRDPRVLKRVLERYIPVVTVISGAIVGALAIMVAGLAVALAPARTAQSASLPAGAAKWSEQSVAAELKQGHLVFVYFTADWCLTCKANEAAAIDRAQVQDAFKAAGVKTLVGDWTNGDPEITRFLESRSRAGVPLYLWYELGRDAEELPQILTPSMLISRARQPRR
jgi:thiol:disulfide interchange protein